MNYRQDCGEDLRSQATIGQKASDTLPFNSMNETVLFVRMDRIGDLILSLPCDQQLTGPSSHWFVSAGCGFLLTNAEPRRACTEFSKSFSWRGLFLMWKTIRRLRPAAAVVFHAPWWVGLALCLARVPVRIGRYSQWHSFLFFNRGVRQKRHLSERHELEYNSELCLRLPGSVQPASAAAPLRLRAPSTDLQKWRLQPHGFFVVHPGMGGSALNWPTQHYVELIRQLLQYRPVVITGTAMDDAYIQPIYLKLKDLGGIFWLQNKLSSEELLTVYSQASCVIAPSTGVAHVAASLGTAVVGLYSPILAHSARRWRPLGKHVTVLEAPATTPAEENLRAIAVATVLQSALDLQQ